nr:unnamed protein product [Digitaria exilis]
MGSSSTRASAAAAAAPSRRKVALYLTLLTLQYGAQPLISKRFVRQDTIVTSLVLATEAAKVWQKQSSKQILALALLISAAVLLSVGESSSKGSKGGSSDYVLLYGIIPVTVASMLSGLASSLCQWASQVELTHHITFEDTTYGHLLTAKIFNNNAG